MLNNAVLLIEDDPHHAKLTRQALRQFSDVEIVLAKSGDEAVQKLDEGLDPVLILLDLKLPGTSGLEILTAIRGSAELRHIPAVFLTTSLEPADLRAAYNAGANGYVSKPVRFSEFRKAVEAIAVYWLGFNELPRDAAFGRRNRMSLRDS